MPELERLVETDVLIIGGGIAGLFAAVRAKQLAKRVTIVDKGPIGHTSQAYFALGGHQALLPEDDMEKWLQDVVYIYDGLCDQEFVESIYRDSYDRIKDLERWGVEFMKESDGKYRRFVTRGLESIRMLRPQPYGAGGEREVNAVINEANKLGVQFLSRIFITGLLKHRDRIAGAIGFHVRSGRFYAIKANAVVIATGQCCFKSHHEDTAFATGDGMAISFRAGAELVGLEFVTYHDMPVMYGWENMGTAFPMGAQLLNAQGEVFMNKYSPVLKNKIDYAFLARAMAMETKQGRNPFYLDHTPIKPEDMDFLRNRHGWAKLQIQKLVDCGIKHFDERQPFMPMVYYCQGIKADVECRATLPGLFIAGRVRGGEPGILMGSWSIATCTVTGYRAGEKAAKFAETCEPYQLDTREIEEIKKGIYSPLEKKGIPPEEVLIEIQETLFPYDVIILKHENRLKKALGKIQSIKHDLLPRMGARDIHYLVEHMQVQNMLLIAELVLKASLLRTESRASHYREDYPVRDNENWLKYITVSGSDNEFKFHTEPLPIDKYKIKPSRYYSDNFKVPD